MNFQPTEEQILIRDTVVTFAAEKIRPAAREADENETIPGGLIQQGWENGLVQSTIPEAFGGIGEPPSAITGTLISEVLGWGDLSIALHLLSPQLILQPLIALGNEQQKQQVLPAYTGEHFTAGTAALLEPHFSFDIQELATTATRQNETFILNRTKCFVPLAPEATQLLVYARGADGLAAFLVPRARRDSKLPNVKKNGA